MAAALKNIKRIEKCAKYIMMLSNEEMPPKRKTELLEYLDSAANLNLHISIKDVIGIKNYYKIYYRKSAKSKFWLARYQKNRINILSKLAMRYATDSKYHRKELNDANEYYRKNREKILSRHRLK
jgi:hypothetical protein